jgi:hypothetical protein
METATERKIELSLIQGSKIAKEFTIPAGLGVIDNPQETPPAGFGCFRVMTPKDGDKRVVWDSQDFSQIREAKEMFDELVAEGLCPYRVGTNGRASSDVMDEFDPHAEEVIFMPIAMVAGG